MPTLKIARRSNRQFAVNLSNRRNWYAEEATADAEATKTTETKTETKAETKDDTKFTKADLDAAAANSRKGAEATGYKKAVKEIGFDPDDPKAVDTVKALIAAAKKAEDDKKTAEDKLNEQILSLQKERDEAINASARIQQERNIDRRNDDIKTALGTAKCTNTAKVMALISVMQADELKATLKDDGTVDKAAITTLVDAAKKEHKEYFVGGGPGIPATAPGGRASDNGRSAEYAALDRAARRNI